MSFQPPVPVEKVLKEIYRKAYVLPAIQREFVWSTEKVRMLFDSLLRGYPIGSFLFWKVEPDQAKEFTFYDFVRDYHEKDSPYAPAFKVPPGQGVIAILDGQQRLTSLNIGLHGSHAERQPRKWAANPDAYPKKRLSLDLLGEGSDEELGMQYDFRFLTAQEAAPEPGGPDHWYRVGDVLSLADSGPAIMADLERRRLGGKQPFQILYDLYRAMREAPLINYYLEESQDSDKVLDIFVRVNSAGTPLSYSDLLLSMATNQWQELDAREEVRSLLTALNGGSTPFDFTKDLVLKAGLMLIDAPDIRVQSLELHQDEHGPHGEALAGDPVRTHDRRGRARELRVLGANALGRERSYPDRLLRVHPRIGFEVCQLWRGCGRAPSDAVLGNAIADEARGLGFRTGHAPRPAARCHPRAWYDPVPCR
jgi:hypothetical protein